MEAIAIPSALDRILYKLGSEDQATARELIDEMMGRGPSGAGYAGGILSAGVDGIKVAEAVALDLLKQA